MCLNLLYFTIIVHLIVFVDISKQTKNCVLQLLRFISAPYLPKKAMRTKPSPGVPMPSIMVGINWLCINSRPYIQFIKGAKSGKVLNIAKNGTHDWQSRSRRGLCKSYNCVTLLICLTNVTCSSVNFNQFRSKVAWELLEEA